MMIGKLTSKKISDYLNEFELILSNKIGRNY
jgi:hypothetical protein